MMTSTSLWPESLRTVAPWLLATAATLAAFVILSMFIDTLHLSVQRGAALRTALAAQGTTPPVPDTHMAATDTHPTQASR